MQFICHLNLRSESADRQVLTADLVQAEIQRIHQLLGAGTIRHAWKKADAVAVVLALDVADEAECRDVIGALPFSIAGILGVEIVSQVEPYVDGFPERGAH